jgi:hypothetical protein
MILEGFVLTIKKFKYMIEAIKIREKIAIPIMIATIIPFFFYQ